MIEYAMLSGSSEERHDEFNIFHQEISADLETNQENIKIAFFNKHFVIIPYRNIKGLRHTFAKILK